MTEEQMRDLVRECGLDWHKGYMPLFDGDPTNRFAVLIAAAIAEDRRAQQAAEPVSLTLTMREAICWGADNYFSDENWDAKVSELVAKVKAALVAATAQPAAEPVAWRWSESNGARWFDWTTDWDLHRRALATEGCLIEYAHSTRAQPAAEPPKRIPLTDTQIQTMFAAGTKFDWAGPELLTEFAREIERAHGIT